VILFGILFFNNLLLTAAQLLFINIVTDGLPAVALGSDPAEKGIMRFRPARFQAAIIDKRVWTEMLIFGALMSIALLVHFGYIFDGSAESDVLAKSVAFAGMVVYEMVRLIDIRTDYHIRWFTNPWLSVAMLGSFALLGIVMYVPSIAEIFDLTQIPLRDWLIIVAVSVLLFVSMKLVNPVLNRLMPDVPRS
jgi:Ca2+-transporting ATPase